MAGLTRREILSLPLGFGCAIGLPAVGQGARNSGSLRGFIVSDAHFGSVNVSQPTPAEQRAVMHRIFTRFPNLDVCIDTGDAHHSEVPGKNGKALARQNWLTHVAGQSPVPFFYVPGNHELSSAKADPEVVTCDMGSLALRPYHSFTVKDIHFVCIPQLVKTILVSKETIEWLKLDLAVHRDKTVVILAHNSISGTTYSDGVTAYREIVNSPEVLRVLDAHPNVIAWMHGHNHQYEIVEKDNRVYVSNGRIGGFNPPAQWGAFGQGHLGGIYFEISRSHLLVRAFSATADRFMDELGMPHLTLRKTVATSFSAVAPASTCAGRGAAAGGTLDWFHHHEVGRAPQGTIFAMQGAAEPINDNWDLNLETQLFRRKPQDKLIGFRVDKKDGWRRWEEGIEIMPRSDGQSVVVSVPQGSKEVAEPARGSYLPCQAGNQYLLQLDLDAQSGGQIVAASFRLRSSAFKTLGQWPLGNVTLKPGVASHTFRINIPERRQLAIADDQALQLLVFFEISELAPGLKIDNIKVSPTGEKDSHTATRLTVGNQTLKLANHGDLQQFPLSAQTAGQTRTHLQCHHHKQLSWLIRTEQLQWQVRNAIVHGTADELHLRVRHQYVAKSEMVISCFGAQTSPYVTRLTNAASATIKGLQGKGDLALRVHQAIDQNLPVTVEIRSKTLPDNAKALNITSSTEGLLQLVVKPGEQVVLAFPVLT